MPTLSVFEDVPLAQKLGGSLLKIYKQDNHPRKMFLSYKGKCPVLRECKTDQSLSGPGKGSVFLGGRGIGGRWTVRYPTSGEVYFVTELPH